MITLNIFLRMIFSGCFKLPAECRYVFDPIRVKLFNPFSVPGSAGSLHRSGSPAQRVVNLLSSGYNLYYANHLDPRLRGDDRLFSLYPLRLSDFARDIF